MLENCVNYCEVDIEVIWISGKFDLFYGKLDYEILLNWIWFVWVGCECKKLRKFWVENV